MTKSLVVAILTFASLGVYYRSAENDAGRGFVEDTNTVAEARRAARGAALAGVNVAKEGLAESWRSGVYVGRYGGAKYTASSLVKDERAAVRSIGRAFRPGAKTINYELRVDIYRRLREAAARDSLSDRGKYSYRIRPVATGSG